MEDDAFSDAISAEDKQLLDLILIDYLEESDAERKKRLELECLKLFKKTDLDPGFIEYLNVNGAMELAEEMAHFQSLHDSVPHTHERRKAA